MHIKTITSQHRRDFRAIFKCEHCGFEFGGPGYDDAHFHTVVVPDMKCGQCGKTASADYTPRTPRYQEGEQV